MDGKGNHAVPAEVAGLAKGFYPGFGRIGLQQHDIRGAKQGGGKQQYAARIRPGGQVEQA